MSGARVLAVVLGVFAILAGLTMSAGGGIVIGLDALFGSEVSREVSSPGSAVVVGEVAGDEFEIGSASYEGDFEIRLRATGVGDSSPIFVGVGRTTQVAAYLDRVARTSDLVFSAPRGGGIGSAAPDDPRIPAPPSEQGLWSASASGTGEQSLEWDVRGGDWSFVVMRASGQRGVAADVRVAVRVPFLDWAARHVTPEVIVLGLVLIVAGIVLMVLGLRGRRRPPGGPTVAPEHPPVNPVGKF